MDAKLTGSSEIYRDKALNSVLNLADSIVARHGAIVHQLSLGKISCLARASMECWDQREQFEAIWNLKVFHQNKIRHFNAIFGRWVLGLF